MQLTRAVKAGAIDRVAHGVYAISDRIGDPMTDLRAAWLALQPALTVLDGLPVTTAQRTIQDLLGSGMDGDQAGTMIVEALNSGLLKLTEAAAAVAQACPATKATEAWEALDEYVRLAEVQYDPRQSDFIDDIRQVLGAMIKTDPALADARKLIAHGMSPRQAFQLTQFTRALSIATDEDR